MRQARISVTSHNMYCSCQRKYWYKYIVKQDQDDDWVDPGYFRFGKAAHECLESCRYDGMKQDTNVMRRICASHELSESDTAKVLACVRGYFAQWLHTEIIGAEIWIENEFMTGKVDAVARQDDQLFIVENKFLSEIPPSIELDLPVDPQLNLYASCADLIEDKLDQKRIKGKIAGIWYRIIRKPKERQKKAEELFTYSARCTIEGFEWKAPLSRLKSEDAFSGIKATLAEISRKYNEDEFIRNTRSCVQYGSPCPYYSKCHDILYSQRKDDSFNPDLF